MTGSVGGDALAGAPLPNDERRPAASSTPRLVWLVVGVVAVYAVLWLLGQGPLAQVYTAEWVARRIAWFFAPLTVLLVVLSRRVLPAALSILGLVLGVLVGELTGGRIFAAETVRLEAELASGRLQSWEPAHHGWWIASLVFVALTAVGGLIAQRSNPRRR